MASNFATSTATVSMSSSSPSSVMIPRAVIALVAILSLGDNKRLVNNGIVPAPITRFISSSTPLERIYSNDFIASV